MAYRDTGHGVHEHHDVKYLAVFIALCVFTSLSVLADVLHGIPYPVKVVLVLSISTAKALCVMLFFMHLKFEGAWKYILLAPTTILAIGLPIALMPDVATRYYISAIPQDGDYEEAMAHHQTHSGEGEGEHKSGNPESHPEGEQTPHPDEPEDSKTHPDPETKE